MPPLGICHRLAHVSVGLRHARGARAVRDLLAFNHRVDPLALSHLRLRRDFGALLTLIRSNVLLHPASRLRDKDVRVVAPLDAYLVVHHLVADLIADGAEATVPGTVRETVDAVTRLDEGEGISLPQLVIDKSAAARPWQSARRRGYLKNEETRRGRPARLRTAIHFQTTSRSCRPSTGSPSVAVLQAFWTG
jgi:hypothetical protein